MVCHNCGKEVEIDFTKIPNNVKSFDTKCDGCGSFVKIGNPNYVTPSKDSDSDQDESNSSEE